MTGRRSAILALIASPLAFAKSLRPLSNDDARIIKTLQTGTRIPDYERGSLSSFNYSLELAEKLRMSMRVINPRGGDFGRGLEIPWWDVARADGLLRRMEFEPYIFNEEQRDEFGQAIPVYGVSGGLTPLLYRVYFRFRDGRCEAVPFEYVHPSMERL